MGVFFLFCGYASNIKPTTAFGACVTHRLPLAFFIPWLCAVIAPSFTFTSTRLALRRWLRRCGLRQIYIVHWFWHLTIETLSFHECGLARTRAPTSDYVYSPPQSEHALQSLNVHFSLHGFWRAAHHVLHAPPDFAFVGGGESMLQSWKKPQPLVWAHTQRLTRIPCMIVGW